MITIKIIITDCANHATAQFPYDKERVAKFRKKFSRARWDALTRAWSVPGKTAAKRLIAWRDEELAEHGPDADAKARAALDTTPLPASRLIRLLTTGISVTTPYRPDLVALLRSLPGAEWQRALKYWLVPFRSVEALRAALPEIERMVTEIRAEAAVKAKADETQRERERAVWAEENAKARAEREAKRATRIMVLADSRVPVGQPFRVYGGVVVAESYGKSWVETGEDGTGDSRFWDQRVCYAYIRPATTEEIADLNVREAEEKARVERRRRDEEMLRSLEERARHQGDRPDSAGDWPQGETIAAFDQRLSIYGGGREWRLCGDGLWFIEGNGADGDDWSRNNLRGAVGYRVPAEPELVAGLRRLAASLT